ncbi:MAG TPA: hypothetical protein VNV43_09775 [Candidatus Acidoferrales bacterium]|jgi:hypothetical protein|nr:hypothetical protein [Candidatus Acidoferrales bacterium]
MFGEQITALQTRKKALLLESDLNRLRLCAEVNNLREIGGFTKKLKYLERFGGLGRALAPLAAVIVAVGVGRTSLAGGLLRKALVAVPAFIRLWRMVSDLMAEFR